VPLQQEQRSSNQFQITRQSTTTSVTLVTLVNSQEGLNEQEQRLAVKDKEVRLERSLQITYNQLGRREAFG
jgi:hypothetical protein